LSAGRFNHAGGNKVPLAAAILVIVLLAIPGRSEVLAADAEEGRRIARTWCAACHVVEATQTNASDVGPAFSQIANDPATTGEGLRNWLADPHPPMPKFRLSTRQIDDLIAYIQGLAEN
jgi:mono/diheme cytochrome c family protein